MHFKKIELSLEDKNVTANVQVYEKSDLEKLKDYYWQWVDLSNSLQEFGGEESTFLRLFLNQYFVYISIL